ncbi:class I SAM-dependent methyltransferase [Nonomuraea sp. NN258]|uniref:class I SAM-dependent methyltransferase n=1 Tax=Nonomuraea antri TaxID=2730852 RepID=UPI0015682C69|nr:class I SAM-dependent methyltransferase [Nonomuraea antri]NRQ38912.1 class I SAM-dependent methyltransferase [Nonomuraea antri]
MLDPQWSSWLGRRMLGGMETIDNHQLAWLGAFLPRRPARVLDAGCGRGELAAALMRLGHLVTAVDVSPEAVAAARAAGVPARVADMTAPADPPGAARFDVVVMSLSLHHMRPVEAALDRARDLLAPGGVLLLDEFAWDRADRAAAAWFYDAGSSPDGAEPAGTGAGAGPEPYARWREAHGDHATGEAMVNAVADRFEITDMRPEPYLTRYIGGKFQNPDMRLVERLWQAERAGIAAGTLPATGLRIAARRM